MDAAPSVAVRGGGGGPRLPPAGAAQRHPLPPPPLRRCPHSALARAWRRRWESAPFLKFNWGDGADPGAITGVLQRYSCPIHEFRYSHIGETSFRYSDHWIRLLAQKVVQSLVLGFERSHEGLVHTLHPSIFLCRELTVLDLQCCDVPATPPGFGGFPNLTFLRLFNVDFPEGARELELLIVTSPLLESMSLKLLRVPYSNGGYNQWVIQAPKLRRFNIAESGDHGWQINDLPSLEEANIDCASDHDFVKLVTALAWTRKFVLHMPIGDDTFLEGFTCPFNNLKSLTLYTSLSLLSSIFFVFCLLRNAVKLEDLDIVLNDEYSQDDEIDRDFLNAQWTDDLFSNLIVLM